MTRDEIKSEILKIFSQQFEIEDPGLDDDLRESYEFDSIDAIELLREIEILLGSELTRAEKKNAMDIRTISQILDYIELLAQTRSQGAAENMHNAG
jgi:acyl carrier protein